MNPGPLVAILTDFGTADPFAGIMKGVLARIAPGIQFIDLTHEIPPGDIRRGAITLWQAVDYFTTRTIFLCVVDPGVGTFRRGLMVKSRGYTFVGPDNGLFTFVFKPKFQAWELSNPNYALPNPGTTFHGRDIFAPAAAYAANGIPGQDFGPSVHDPVRLPLPRFETTSLRSLRGEILHSDKFGNLLTSLGRFLYLEGESYELDPWLDHQYLDQVQEKKHITTHQFKLTLPNGTELPYVKTFADVPPGRCAFLVGSSGLLEIVANRQSAADLLGLRGGELVILSF